MSNFTLGYARVALVRAPIIFKHLFQVLFLHPALHVPSFRGDGVLMSRQPDVF